MKEYIVRIEHGADGAVHYFRTGDEIVRCVDCKHSEMNDELGFLMCHYRMCYPEYDDYCSFGERKTAESE